MATRIDDEYAVCPHCGHAHGDPSHWVTDSPQETTCDGCGAKFKVWADYSVTFISYSEEGMKLTVITGGKTGVKAMPYPVRVKPVCALNGWEAVVDNDGDLVAALAEAVMRSAVAEAVIEVMFNRASL